MSRGWRARQGCTSDKTTSGAIAVRIACRVRVTTRSAARVRFAKERMIDYVAIGPVFDTLTKDTGYSAVGIERVRHAAEHNRWPVVAIGGITLETAPEVIAAGASSVAVISDSSRQAIRQVASGNICSASAG